MLTLRKIDSFDAGRLHRKLSIAWREAKDEATARRMYRMMGVVYLHLHKLLLADMAKREVRA